MSQMPMTPPSTPGPVGPSGPNLPHNGKAITSLVLGIVSIPTCCCYGVPSLICGALALIFGYMARQELATGRYSQGSHGMNLAGMICGAIGLALSLAMWVVLALGIAGKIIEQQRAGGM